MVEALMHFPWDDKRPLNASEIFTTFMLLLIIVGLLAAETMTNFHPMKLATLFFILAWAPLLVLHEAGHALMAAWLGWHVGLVSIGMGPRLTRLHVGRTVVDLRLWPVEGFVVPVPTALRHPRLESALIYFAGPGIEILVLGVLVVLIGPDTLFARSESLPLIATQGVALALAAGIVINLVPHGIVTSSGMTANDGLGIIRSFLLPESHYAALIGWNFEEPPGERVEEEPADEWQR
jgi:hypothetical protein